MSSGRRSQGRCSTKGLRRSLYAKFLDLQLICSAPTPRPAPGRFSLDVWPREAGWRERSTRRMIRVRGCRGDDFREMSRRRDFSSPLTTAA